MTAWRRLAAGLLATALAAPAGAARAAPPDPWRALHGDAPQTPPITEPVARACREHVAPPLPTRAARLAARAERIAAARDPASGAPACEWLAAAELALALGLAPEAAAEARHAEDLADAAGAAEVAAAARWLRAEARFAAGRADEAGALYRTFAAEPLRREAPARAADGGAAGSAGAVAAAPDPAPDAAPEAPVAPDTGRGRDASPLAVLAALRLAEVALVERASPAALAAFDAALPRAAALGVPVAPFAVRAAAAAAALGRSEEARERLERALAEPLDDALRMVARLRLAELLAGAGREGEARAQLGIVQGLDAQAPAARLAALRELELDLEALAREPGLAAPARALRAAALAERVARLEPPSPSVIADYAQQLAARLDVLANEPARALERLLGLGGAEADAALGDALARLATPDGDDGECAQLVALLAPRLPALVRRAPDPEPLAALARCQARLLGPDAALPLQRALVRRFGARGRAAVALDLAESLLAAGQLDAVAAAANERLAVPGDDAAAWRRLRAEVELARGDVAAAAQLVAPLLAAQPIAPAAPPPRSASGDEESFAPDEAPRDGEAQGEAGAPWVERAAPWPAPVAAAPVPARERLAALALLARAARSAPRDLDLGERLMAAIERLDDELGAEQGGEGLGDAALLAGHRARREGQARRAASLYAIAAAALPPGERRAQAWYWMGALAPAGDDDGRDAAFAASAAEPAGGAWAALARERRAAAALGSARLARGDG